MVHAKHLLAAARNVMAQLDAGDPDRSLLELEQAVVEAAVEAELEHPRNLVKPGAVASRSIAGRVGPVVECHRAAHRRGRGHREGACDVHAVARGYDLVGVDQGYAAARDLVALDRDDDPHAASDPGPDVGWIGHPSHVLPVRGFGSVPERVVLRLGVNRVLQERVTVRQGGRILDPRVSLPATVAIELDAPGGGTAGDVADRNEAARQRIDVDRTGPELGAVGRGEDVGVVAQVDLEPVAPG